MSTSHTLTFEGCNYLRHRIILSLLSSRPIKISQIRSRDDKPGLWESEASLIRLIDRLTNGSKIEINETGTRLLFSPGLLQGGTIEHECSKARSISYYLEVLIAIAPFCATSLDVVLKGVTSSTKIDPSVDHIIHSLVPLLKRRNLSTTLKVVKRGCAPKGGGEVHFTCSILSSLNADQWIKCGKVKRVRGVCYCCRVSPAVAHRAVEAAKGILLKFLPDVYIAIDQRKGASAGLSPGYGVVLVAETTEGSTYVGESIFSEDSTAEAVGIDAAKNLLQEVVQGGVCNSNAQYLPLLQMAVSQRDVSKVLLGSLTPFTIEFLRHLKTFFNLLFKIETISNEENEQTDIDQSKFMLTYGEEEACSLRCPNRGYRRSGIGTKKLRLTQPLTTESEEVQRDHLLWHTYDIPTDEDRQEVIDFIIQDLSSPRSMRQLADEGLLISAQCLAVLAEQGLKEAQLNSIVSITSHAQHPDILCALILTLQHAAVSNPDFKEQCLAVTHSLVTSQQFQVPVIVACLSLVGSVLSSNDDDRLIQLWNRLWLHPDARVRMSVLKSAMNAVKIGYEPNIVMYHRSIRLFSDDFEGVRAAAVEFVCLFADKIPLHDIPAPEDPSSNITLVEHAFNAACEMVTDISLKVRTCAVLQIGKLQHVTGSILELTLEQQLMSHLRKKNTSKERRSALVLSGGWATGRRWGDDSPAEFVDTANVSLVKRGACGAFVNGLEDESMQVRIGTVSAISSLARCNVAFAMKSLDSLVDMLNDEIEEVVSAHCVIREDQLEDILSGLDDLSVSIREGIHDLLSVCTLHNKECMRAALQALLRNLKKYTKDKESIWCALHHLGDRHYNLCLPLMDEFLCLHPFFDTVEPNIEDPAYIAVAILVINSAAKCPTLPALFPRFMLQHYNYLRDSLPALIPTLKIEDTNFRYVPMEKPSLPTSRRDTALTLYSEVRSCLTEVLSLPERFRLQMFPRLLRDLAQLKSSHLAGDASFIGMFIRVHRTYDASMAVLRQIGPSAQIELPMEGTVEAGRQMFQHIISMETRFAGLTADEKWRLRQSRVKIAAIVLLLELFKNNASSESQTKLCTYFLSSLMQLRSLNVDSFTSGLISQLSNVEPQKVGLISKYLRYLLLHAKSLDLFFPTNMLSRASAKIISPSSSDSIQRNSTALRLRTDVGLSHHPWTEAGEISLLICLSAVPLLTALTQSSISTPTREKLLPISEPVKLQILPKFKV